MSVNKAIFNLLDFKKRAGKILRRLCFMGYSPVIPNNYGCHQGQQKFSPPRVYIRWAVPSQTIFADSAMKNYNRSNQGSVNPMN